MKSAKENYETLQKQINEVIQRDKPYKPETNNLKIGVGRCKCKAELLDKETNFCGNCGQRLDWS